VPALDWWLAKAFTPESHWVHQRPGYRCRHGHTSAKPPAAGRAKNLYLREEHILARVATQLRQPYHPTLSPNTHDPRELATYLHSHNMMITCDARSCTLDGHEESDPDRPALFGISDDGEPGQGGETSPA
jgi:hypothetical protein